MKTVTIVTLICGTTTRKKICRSLAPSMRAASRVSPGTPLTAAESSTMAKPTFIQSSITISRKLLKWKVFSCSQAIGSPPNAVTMAFWMPTCGWPAGRKS